MEEIKNSLAKKVFINMVERASIGESLSEPIQFDGIVKSINEFLTILVDANNIYNSVFQIPADRQLVFSEEIPSDQISTINNITGKTEINSDINNDLKDIRVVTYDCDEKPAIISTRTIGGGGIQNIKWKYAGSFPDPEHTGYSIIRLSREVEADISFKIWGVYLQDIRQRASLLKDIIDTNIWYFKGKGLRDIIWTGSYESVLWESKSISKYKTQKYMIRFSEIKEFREKNLEQIVVQFGFNN